MSLMMPPTRIVGCGCGVDVATRIGGGGGDVGCNGVAFVDWLRLLQWCCPRELWVMMLAAEVISPNGIGGGIGGSVAFVDRWWWC